MAAMPMAFGDDSDEEYYELFMRTQAAKVKPKSKKKRGGSSKGKAPNKERDREYWGERLLQDYFGDNPTYGDGMEL